MLQAVNWSDKLSQIFGGHRGRVLRILILFLCALGVLVGVYRARSVRLEKEKLRREKPLLKIHAASLLPTASTAKWVIVGNPDEDLSNPFRNGGDYVCSVASVAREAGWKSVIIGPKLDCCKMPDCYPINRTQFLRMNYRTAAVLKNLTETGNHPQTYKEAVRNIAFLWVIHRGARWVFDAYVEEYQSANVTIPRFEEELTRQLHTLALDESLALVQERGRTRGGLFRNPYSHFGRPDVRLVPNARGVERNDESGAGGATGNFHHAPFHHYSSAMNLAHGHSPNPNNLMNSHKYQDFPTFRIYEVRPPHIEKFLEIDEGWWDLRAPALVLPGDTMPPLCTRNTLFSPEVFWALPLLPDYSRDDFEEHAVESPTEDGKDGGGSDMTHVASRIPPWYIRGLWSQSLLGDLGGSIRLTLSRVPTLQMNQDYFAGGDYEQNPSPTANGKNNSSNPSNTGSIPHSAPGNRTGSSKLLKRWHCRSRSTFRCLLLMSKELSKSIYLKRYDLKLIEAWIVDLKNIHYMEPPMLPRRRSHANPCLGADGLHGVSFYPSLEPNQDLLSEDFISKRNDTFKELVTRFSTEPEVSPRRERREAEAAGAATAAEIASPLPSSKDQIDGLLPPRENSTYVPSDWSTYERPSIVGHGGHEESSYAIRPEDSRTLGPYETYYRRYKQDTPHHHLAEIATSEQPITVPRSRIDYYQHGILSDRSGAYRRSGLPVVDKSASYLSDPRTAFLTASRSAKHLHEALSKHHDPSVDGFPILKAMTETMCPGFGDLIPFQPETIHSDVLLIIAFTNHHYDLIPTLEVLYRSSFPNMLYCGNPHESVELFLRKYQSVEHRSFSFLPTYTRATYECVLGAMEMNYEVKGYIVITDETLIKTWNIDGLDKSKIWVSSSSDHENRHVPVTKESWPKLDPRGQKLPRLIDGLANTWKMLTYFLVGQDAYIVEPATIKKKRSVADEATAAPLKEPEHNSTAAFAAPSTETTTQKQTTASSQGNNDSSDKYETLETSYVPADGNRGVNRIGQAAPSTDAVNDSLAQDSERSDITAPNPVSAPASREGKSASDQWDLTVSDWSGDNKSRGDAGTGFGSIPMPELDGGQEASNETYSGIDETTDDVEVGEDDDEPTSSDSDLTEDAGVETAPSPSPENVNNSDASEDDGASMFLAPPTSEATTADNSTDLIEGAMNINATETGIDNESSVGSGSAAESSVPVPTTPTPMESSVGVPLYHVEHVEPPTPPTYHRPEERLSDKDAYNVSQPSATNTSVPEVPSPVEEPVSKHPEIQGVTEDKSSITPTKPTSGYVHISTTEKPFIQEVPSSTTTTSTTPTPAPGGFGGGSEEVVVNDGDSELKREMEVLLDGLKKVYLNLVGVVQEYQEMNETSGGSSHNKTKHNHHEIGTDGKLLNSLLEDSKSHRISPREFRHIRCTMQDDGHQSELCFILREYVNTLLLNLGINIHLYHDTIPMYYLPSSSTKPFYSVANVLLHHGVMDELALPLLFRGLAPESEWIKLVRSPSLNLAPVPAPAPATSTSSSSSASSAPDSTAGSSGHSSSSSSRSSSSSSIDSSNISSNINNNSSRSEDRILSEKSQYLHPFHLHKVYSEQNVRRQFCKHYLLRLFQM